MFDKQKYFSSLHLAGAADEIYGDLLQSKGKTDQQTKNAMTAKKLGDAFYKNNQPPLCGLKKVANEAKNSIKHVRKGKNYQTALMTRPKIEAFRMMQRAIQNARRCRMPLGVKINGFMRKKETDLE